jgi:hypothetical protein
MSTMKKKRLGRGLGSLIGNIEEDADTVEAAGLSEIDIDRIQRGRYQPRQVFEPEALQELADSIRAQGVVQPIVSSWSPVSGAGVRRNWPGCKRFPRWCANSMQSPWRRLR